MMSLSRQPKIGPALGDVLAPNRCPTPQEQRGSWIRILQGCAVRGCRDVPKQGHLLSSWKEETDRQISSAKRSLFLSLSLSLSLWHVPTKLHELKEWKDALDREGDYGSKYKWNSIIAMPPSRIAGYVGTGDTKVAGIIVVACPQRHGRPSNQCIGLADSLSNKAKVPCLPCLIPTHNHPLSLKHN